MLSYFVGSIEGVDSHVIEVKAPLQPYLRQEILELSSLTRPWIRTLLLAQYILRGTPNPISPSTITGISGTLTIIMASVAGSVAVMTEIRLSIVAARRSATRRV